MLRLRAAKFWSQKWCVSLSVGEEEGRWAVTSAPLGAVRLDFVMGVEWDESWDRIERWDGSSDGGHQMN